MRAGDLLHSVRFVVADRARAALTLLGIMIGAGSIVLLASLLRGGEEALIRSNQDAVDADLIEVRREEVPLHQTRKTRRELSRTDGETLAASRALDGAEVGTESSRGARILYEGRKKRVTVVSANPSALALYRLEMHRGRFLHESDLADRRRVCVIGHEVWKELLEEAPIDALTITVEGQRWSVIGVLAEKPYPGSTDSTNVWNRKVVIPETTYDAIFAVTHEVDRIRVRRRADADAAPLAALRRVIESTLRRRHFGVQNFKVEDESDHAQERLIFDMVKLLLFSTGLIALLVGGINIMNIMLVTVTERTREIGVRRAVGAAPRMILIQFLFESAAVSLIGGALGVTAGLTLSWASAALLDRLLGRWPLHVELLSIALGLGLSVVTGVVFGLYPAWRAARLDPIEALRSE